VNETTGEAACPSAEQLACLVEGVLDGDEVAAVQRHVGDCERCCEILASLGRGSDDDDGGFRPAAGATVGRFVLLEPLGRGAMGVVWTAFDPELLRRIAIKLVAADVLGGVASDCIREAQTMARLSHPNVTTVHATGIVGDRLFIAMDLVEGGTLREWLAEEPRPMEEILARFIAAGRGLAHAHAHGVVHRDFKPDNVLCGRDGRVCVTDFGLAQAPLRRDTCPTPLAITEPDLERLTCSGAVVGTPAYMPPEQFSGRRTDARSDQFSFCVALWEALYGTRPFAGRSFHELAIAVKTGSICSPPVGRAVPARLERAIRRGLCTDRAARWPDMPSLLAALGPPRQRPGLALAAGAGVLALVGAGLWWDARADAVPEPCTDAAAQLRGVWDDARAASVREALLASSPAFGEATAGEAIDGLDAQAEDWIAVHTDTCRAAANGERAPALLDRSMACLGRRRAELAAAADVLARGDATAEHALQVVSALPPVDVCGDAEAMQTEQPVPEDPQLAAAVTQQLDALARTYALSRAGALVEAESVANEVVDAAAVLEWPPLRAEALLIRGKLRRIRGDYEAASDDLLGAWELALASGHDRVAASAATEQVVVATQRLALDEGLTWSEHALAAARRLGHDEKLEAQVTSDIGLLHTHRGDFDEATRMLERSLALLERAPRRDAVSLAETLSRLGAVAIAQSDVEAGKAHFGRAIALLEESLGPDHAMLVAPVQNLGLVHYHAVEYDEAERLFRRAFAIQEATKPGHPDLVSILTNLGNVETAREQFLAALAYYERAHELALRLHGPDDAQVGVALVNVAMIHHALGHYEEARAGFERTLDLWQREMPDHPALAYPLTGLGASLVDLGRFEEGRRHLERALQLRTASPATAIDLADTERQLARALWEVGGDRSRALALATAARDRLLPLRENAGERLPEVEQWIAARNAL
jgi:tetratricopeptide (TPR) repeat protein